jgi:hypothetical protein
MPLVLLVVLLGFVTAVPGRAQGPADTTDVLAAPSQVLAFTRGDSTVFDDPALGRAFRYGGPEERFDVYIYPVSVEAGADSLPAAVILARETRSFMEGLPEGIRRGWYEAFQPGFDEVHDLELETGLVPGRLATVAYRARGRVTVSSFYVFHVRGQLVKVRSTVPAERFGESQGGAFVRKLVEELLGTP